MTTTGAVEPFDEVEGGCEAGPATPRWPAVLAALAAAALRLGTRWGRREGEEAECGGGAGRTFCWFAAVDEAEVTVFALEAATDEGELFALLFCERPVPRRWYLSELPLPLPMVLLLVLLLSPPLAFALLDPLPARLLLFPFVASLKARIGILSTCLLSVMVVRGRCGRGFPILVEDIGAAEPFVELAWGFEGA